MKTLTGRDWTLWRNIAATLATWERRRRPTGEMFGGRPIGNTEKRRRTQVSHRWWTRASGRVTASVWVRECWLFLWAAVETVNIGLPYQRPSRKTEVKERKKVLLENKKNPEMERDNRLRTCKCIREASWSLKRKQSRSIKSRMMNYDDFRLCINIVWNHIPSVCFMLQFYFVKHFELHFI